MAMVLQAGQEMKMTIKSTDTGGNKNKTIRYLDPMATNTIDQKVTGLAKAFMANSQDTYTATTGSIELGYLNEE